MSSFLSAAVLSVLLVAQREVGSTHPECSIVLQLLQKEEECRARAQNSEPDRNRTEGCVMEWDGVSCWPPASEGESVSVPCPQLLIHPPADPAVVSRRCTGSGWSRENPPYDSACFSEEEEEEEEEMKSEQLYLSWVRVMYSVGYAASLTALLLSALMFCCFRKLLCSRTCLHLQLFLSFMLRSVSVFIKDHVLFSDRSTDHCTVSTLRCKWAVTFFHFCVLSNFSWLLVEALYLQTLLVFTFTRSEKLLWIYSLIGWGSPALTILLWALLKLLLDDHGCWDELQSTLWWIIKFPILLSIFINFLIFLNVSRIIALKTKAKHVNNSEAHVYRRLLRSTLLLLPLFGLHYVVFALFPEDVGVRPRLHLELVLGSFQGFIVALLYCFLNGEVQNEIRGLLRRCKRETDVVDAV